MTTRQTRTYKGLRSMAGLVIAIAALYLAPEAFAQVPAAMISPPSHSTLSSSSVTFQWTPGTGASDRWLYVGTAQNQANIFGNNVGMATSQVVSGIPNGTIYVRLWSLIGSAWWYNDYIYTETGGGGTPAVLISPVNHSTLSSSSVTFQWTPGTGASDHWLYVGTAQSQANIFGSNVGMANSQVVSRIPNGTIYVRLWSLIGSTWWFSDYTFTVVLVGDDYPWQSATANSVNPDTHFYIRNCTDFVAWRMNRDMGDTNPSTFPFTDWMPNESNPWGNAGNWEAHAKNLHYRMDSLPTVGAVAYFSYGHVAYVESVNADGSVNISEFNYPSASNQNTSFNYGYRPNVTNVTAFIHIVH
jgi:surface antigen